MEQPIGLLAIIDEHGEVVGVNGVAFSDDEQKMRAHVAAIDVPRRDDVEFSLTGHNWLILLGLAATFVAILYLLHRAFIDPSIKLTTYVADQMAGAAVSIPTVSATWSRHFEAIAVAFSNSRQYRARLEESAAGASAFGGAVFSGGGW